VPSTYCVCLVNIERSADLIDDGRHDHPDPHRPPPWCQDPARSLVLENLALRHQLAVLQRTAPRPRLRTADRLLWVLLSRLWNGWTDAVSIVQPATVIGWQRTGFKLFWTWKSRRNGQAARPSPRRSERSSDGCPTRIPSGARRGFTGNSRNRGSISQATVSKYLVRHRRPPSQTWRTFLDNHLGSLVASSSCRR
jgi:putative transposase